MPWEVAYQYNLRTLHTVVGYWEVAGCWTKNTLALAQSSHCLDYNFHTWKYHGKVMNEARMETLRDGCAR